MTSRDRHAREKEAFLAVHALPKAERDAALEAACGDDSQLRDSVRSLLDTLAVDAEPEDVTTRDARLNAFVEALSDRYRIEGKVGQGAMGTVYAAHDLKHERRVAVKTLPERVAAALGTDRFEQEVKVTARLNHPHILPLLDSGEAAGVLYYVMPFVEGQTVRDRIQHHGAIAPAEACRLGAEIADALSYAHARDVVHRDIKPENIMLADGHAVVMDFGIARVGPATGDARLTQAWGPMGTPAYMSPEQFWPDHEVDGRADVFSLGLVLYEMLTGEVPHRTGEPHGADPGIRAAIDHAFRQARAVQPPGAAEVVARSSARTPEDRPGAQELGGALSALVRQLGGPIRDGQRRRILAAGLSGFAIAGVVVAAILTGRTTPATPSQGPVSIAVLPFEALGSPAEQYLGDGFADAITARLAQLDGLAVVSRQSARQYRNSEQSAAEIGMALGASYLLEGTVQRERVGDPTSRIRVIPQLVRTDDDSHIWADTYDDDVTALFRVQSDIAERVARELAVALVDPNITPAAPPTDNFEAYELYLRASQHDLSAFDLDVGELRSSVELLERAVELDPDFALALARLAQLDITLFRAADRTPERLAAALEHSTRALELAPQLADSHFASAYYYYFGLGDVQGAREGLETVLELQPSNADALALLAPLLAASGEWEQAVEQAARASDLDPLSPGHAHSAATLSATARDYDTAERYIDRAIDLQPTEASHYGLKAMVIHAGSGDLESVVQLLEQIQSLVAPTELALTIHSFDLWSAVREGEFDPLFERLTLEQARDPNLMVLYLAKAKFYTARQDDARARAYFDSLLVSVEQLQEQLPDNHLTTLMLALGQGGVGRGAEALTSAQRYLEQRPFESDHFEAAAALWHLAFVHTLAGDHSGAIDLLRYALSTESWISPYTLRDNPIWDPLRDAPDFGALLAR